jgi:hypothetical protein
MGVEPLFKPFRALGLISTEIPFAVNRRGKETFVTVGVERTWQVSAGADGGAAGVGGGHRDGEQPAR